MAKEATWGSHHLRHVYFATGQKEGFSSTPKKHQANMREGIIFLAEQQEGASASEITPAIYPPGHEMQMVVQEFKNCVNQKSTNLKVDILPSKI